MNISIKMTKKQKLLFTPPEEIELLFIKKIINTKEFNIQMIKTKDNKYLFCIDYECFCYCPLYLKKFKGYEFSDYLYLPFINKDTHGVSITKNMITTYKKIAFEQTAIGTGIILKMFEYLKPDKLKIYFIRNKCYPVLIIFTIANNDYNFLLAPLNNYDKRKENSNNLILKLK